MDDKEDSKELEQDGSKKILLTVPPDLYEIITKLGERMHRPRAAVVRDILVEVKPILVAMEKALAMAEQGKREQVGRLMTKMTGNVLMTLGNVLTGKKKK